MVVFSGPVTAGSIIEPASMVPFDLAANGYLEEEFLASGTACAYVLEGNDGRDASHASAGSHGNTAAVASGTAGYRTRIVVRRPADPDRFSGTLLVEWLNVSSGFDADADWSYLHEEIFRSGHAYAGVSAQAVGIMGGPSLLGFRGPPFPGLAASDQARYGTLHHPGDQYSFDIFGQIGGALRGAAGPVPALRGAGGPVPAPTGAGGHVQALGGLTPARVLAVGESQSAFYLTSYINAVQPLSPVFDGFLVHSRGAGSAPLTGAGLDREAVPVGVRISADNAAPVLVLEAEGDIVPPLAAWLARQPDSDRFRLWEVAGTAHADAYLLGAAARLLGCDWQINEGPHRFVAQAALHALHRWICEGKPPQRAARIELASQRPPVIARDSCGNALGGVRTPAVDVPVATLSGEAPPDVSGPGWLVGYTTPLDRAALLRLYGDKAGYLAAYTRSLDAALSDGFLLPAHRAGLLADAAAVPFPAEARSSS